jgi:uncharacterized membrane protein
MKKIITTISIALGTYAVAMAQPNQVITGSGVNQSGQAIGQSLFNLIGLAQSVVNALVPLLIGVGVVALFIGVVGFIFQKDAADHAKWAKFMGMALLGLFVMVSIWGIVNFFGSIIGVGQGGGVPVPQVPGAYRN